VSARTVAFATLGCRVNQVDTQEMQAALEAHGWRTVPFGAPADVVVVNSCTVTSRAELSDRQVIRRAGRSATPPRVVVTGCWAQVDPAAVARVRGVDLVVGATDRGRLAGLLDALLESPPAPTDGSPARPGMPSAPTGAEAGHDRAAASPGAWPPAGGGRSRAFVKVQDGCQHRCAFCIVPRARGVSRSRPPEVVLEHVRAMVERGHREVTLTGVDMGHYGADLVPRRTLAALLRDAIGIRGLRWVRLSSVLPAYFTPELIDVITGSDVIAPHLHVPLQSGSPRILRRMRRPYTVAMYRHLVERLAAAVPGLGLGTDIIVGFPGEGDREFGETLALARALPFSYLHVFPYSDRPGTEAVGLDGRVDARTIADRGRRLRALGDERKAAFRRAVVGTTQDALVLETRDRRTGRLVGLTGNYVEVVFDGGDELMRSVVRLRIAGVDGDTALGERAA
jgi:threonylcarbamoyladenosine tRNA methylthiotransferase MtaB